MCVSEFVGDEGGNVSQSSNKVVSLVCFATERISNQKLLADLTFTWNRVVFFFEKKNNSLFTYLRRKIESTLCKDSIIVRFPQPSRQALCSKTKVDWLPLNLCRHGSTSIPGDIAGNLHSAGSNNKHLSSKAKIMKCPLQQDSLTILFAICWAFTYTVQTLKMG